MCTPPPVASNMSLFLFHFKEFQMEFCKYVIYNVIAYASVSLFAACYDKCSYPEYMPFELNVSLKNKL